jgi:putative nucleotidyltransferase with HDIG domain
MNDCSRDCRFWAALAPEVPDHWFVRYSTLHGVHHTQRVYVHAQRLSNELLWADEDTRLVLSAALWHDIGRTNDHQDAQHGAQSAAQAQELGLTEALAEPDADLVLFAIVHHCLSDDDAKAAVGRWRAPRPNGAMRPPGGAPQAHKAPPTDRARLLAEPERALRILWLLKDADALDRVRLQPWEAADPAMLRHPQTADLLPFAEGLYRITKHSAGR